jgi:hypothetical protein
MEETFSVRSVPVPYIERVAVLRSEKLVPVARDSWEPRERRTSVVGSRYYATTSVDREDFMYVVVTVTFGVCNSVRLS